MGNLTRSTGVARARWLCTGMNPGWWEGSRAKSRSLLPLTTRTAVGGAANRHLQDAPSAVPSPQAAQVSSSSALGVSSPSPLTWALEETTDNAKQNTPPCQDHKDKDRQTDRESYFQGRNRAEQAR